jgi:hypothetical protein
MPETDHLRRSLDREYPPLDDRPPEWDDVLRRVRQRPRNRSISGLRIVGVAVVLGVAALVAISPWQGTQRVGVLDRALAAVGDEPVLHVVLERRPTGDPLVYLDSGRPVAREVTTEVWFSEGRALKKTVSRIDGLLVDEVLETPKGGFTQGGSIYTCRWIAEHPVEAAKARVSCPGGPRPGDEQPTLDPALSNFVDHYRAALASGSARRIPGGKVGGRDVIWIEFGAGRTLERVALDKSTYTPVLISTPYGSSRVRTVETMQFEQLLFSRPKPVEAPAGGSVIAEQELDNVAAANAILGGHALWLGPEWRGLRLTSVKRQELSNSYGTRSERRTSRTVGVELRYSSGADRQPAILIWQALSCPMAYGWVCQRPHDPEEGMASLRGSMTLFRRNGLFITIFARESDRSAALELARSLRAVPPL